ncbi:hypothetical protein PYCCODRAFT_619978 [Trametes coccinea BRFM310]|uniref:Secreted protein n=1 Tax=Trametes coccinea (strain BRFM310) TaxID=1353009 RepID=A0A1Y2J4Y3_TRAC3|nr:hypothetical protein PYCCODRAFT_619978 [Trametes coccinea BRFM310]
MACLKSKPLLLRLSSTLIDLIFAFRSLPRLEQPYACCVSPGTEESLQRSAARGLDVRPQWATQMWSHERWPLATVFSRRRVAATYAVAPRQMPICIRISSVPQLTAVWRIGGSPVQWDGGGLS